MHWPGPMASSPNAKHALTTDDGPPSKKIKTLAEVPAQYSDAVRKKLAATSRTGQACDRCKERKMKCDTDPIACQPCRQKNLRCFTTDRVTGQSRERGQSDRAENELIYLQNQLAAYQRKFGPLQPDDHRSNGCPPPSEIGGPSSILPSSRYIGWPAPDNTEPLHNGPVVGTKIDILDGVIDIADWDCPMMEDGPEGLPPGFNLSRKAITNTIFGFKRIGDLRLPSKEVALTESNHFLVVMSQYVPVVHGPSFLELVHRFYDHPATLKVGERVQVLMVLAIMAHQSAVRNHQNSAQKFEDSHRYLHAALGYYRELYQDRTLATLQAMALIIVHFRNLPKPGVSWTYTHKILVRIIDLQYHRDPDKIELPPEENNPLAKELRKRVFHVILGVCVTTGCRVGRPAPWQFQHVDVPLPAFIKDSEISENGISTNLSGHCDYIPCIQLAKLLPLLTELYNNIISVRRPPSEYLKTIDALNTKIIAWRQDWEDTTRNEPKTVSLAVASLLIETWAAEYQLNLHHPAVCTSNVPEVLERNLDVCHKSAKRLLQAFHILSREYKGVDFTWHSTTAYTMGFGLTLYVHRQKRGPVTKEQFETISNELSGWMSLMAYADLVLRTGNHLQGLFKPRVQALEDDYRSLIVDNSSHQRNSSHTFFQPVNGVHPKPQVKPETTPQQTNLSIVPQPNGEVMQPPSVMPNTPNRVMGISQQATPNSNLQWPPGSANGVPPQQVALQYMPPNTLPPGYSPYFQTTPQGPPQYRQPIPTSLAPILNDPNGSVYANYATTDNGTSQTQAVGVTMHPADSLMSFSPNHYYNNHAEAMWPMISMSTQQ